MSLFAVHLGGRLIVTERLRQQLKGARHIAADSGIAHCKTLGIIPELWVGDFDSTGVWLSELFSGVERLEFPSAKARTDGELAVDAALARGATSIALVGGFGGKRTDHALSNLMHMLALGEAGNEAMMTSGDEEAWPVAPRRRDFDLPHGTIFSVIALEDLKGVSLKGVRWPLDNVNVDFGSSLTVSNEVTGTLHVSVKTGRAAIVARISGL
jgi:thiamine pyrophosphokinase